MARMTAGQALAESLRAQGVEVIFGIISSHTLDIFDALYDHRDAICLSAPGTNTPLR